MSKLSPLEQLQSSAGLPQTWLGRALTAMPVIMTVIATLLAGLASSEMTKAQYQRSYASQLQTRAGDQWAFFQAKRLRGEMQRNTLDMLATQGQRPTPVPLPPVPSPTAVNSEVQAALAAAAEDAPPEVMTPLVARLNERVLTEALEAAKDRAKAYDELTGPLLRGFDARPAADRLSFNAARYDEEARLNAGIARVYELQVRRMNYEAERHHLRSQRFFFGMLAAQAAVIVSTFALAARKRNILWGLAAGAGLVAVLFAGYVYLFV